MSCKLRPVGYKVVIKPTSVSERTAGGIILTAKTLETDKLATDEGEVVAIADRAFNFDEPSNSDPKVGDVVKFSRYAGMTIRDEKGEIEFRVVEDKDICAVVEPVTVAEVVPIRAVDFDAAMKMPPVNLSGYVDLPKFKIDRPVADEVNGDCA